MVSIRFCFLKCLLLAVFFCPGFLCNAVAAIDRNDAIVLSIDLNRDYCEEAWNAVRSRTSSEIKSLTLDFNGKIALNPETMFRFTCSQCRDYLEGKALELQKEFKSQTDIEAKAWSAWDKAKNDLRRDFFIWAAEKARPYILKRLSKEDQKKFDTDSEFMQAKAAEYLGNGKELNAYINAYIEHNAPRFFKAQKAYYDVTQGQSAAIINDLNDLLAWARQLYEKMNGLAEEAEKNPQTPYGDLLKKYGLKGEWIDKLQEHEGELRRLDDKFKLAELILIIHNSSSSDLPRHKVEGMLAFVDTFAGIAEDNSKEPIVHLMARFVKDYVKAGRELLQMTLRLGKDIHKRAGYCLGTGVPNEDSRSAALARKGLTICPIAYERKPWNDIFIELGPVNGRIHFWDKKKFIQGREDGGGKPVVQRIYKFISRARAMGYSLDGDVKMVAAIYNASYENGFRGIESRAAAVMEALNAKAQIYKQIRKEAFNCKTDRLNLQLEKQFQFNFDNFLRDMDKHGIEALETAYIAAYLAEEGILGKKGNKRSIAMLNYDRALERLRDFRFVHITGHVLNENNPDAGCSDCAGADLDVRVKGGLEIRGCEAWRAGPGGSFDVYVVATAETVNVSIKASAKGKTSKAIHFNADRPVIQANVFIPFDTGDAVPPKRPPGFIILPDLTGMPYRQAADKITGMGLVIGTAEIGSPASVQKQVGTVEAMQPSAGTKIKPGSKVVLQIFDEIPSAVTVPDIANMSQAAAKNKLKHQGLSLKILKGKESTDPGQVGRVYDQSPESGTLVSPGAMVTVSIYTEGELLGTVPDVRGKLLKKGIAAIRQMGLNPKVELGKETSNASQAGRIYRQSPEAGHSLAPGAQVTVWVYDYLESTANVPEVVGQNIQVAMKTITSSGLKPVFELGRQTGRASQNGMVYQQHPTAGARVKPGAKVMLTVYDYVATESAIPDVVGMKSTTGLGVLQKNGFKGMLHKPLKSAKRKSDQGKIYRQLPKAGTQVSSGETVEIWYYGRYREAVVQEEPPPVTPTNGVPYIDIPEIPGFNKIEIALFDVQKNKNGYYSTKRRSVKPGRFYRPKDGFLRKDYHERYARIAYSSSHFSIVYILMWREPGDNYKKTFTRYCDRTSKNNLIFGMAPGNNFVGDLWSTSANLHISLRISRADKAHINKQLLKKILKQFHDQIEPYAKPCSSNSASQQSDQSGAFDTLPVKGFSDSRFLVKDAYYYKSRVFSNPNSKGQLVNKGEVRRYETVSWAERRFLDKKTNRTCRIELKWAHSSAHKECKASSCLGNMKLSEKPFNSRVSFAYNSPTHQVTAIIKVPIYANDPRPNRSTYQSLANRYLRFIEKHSVRKKL